MSNDNEIYPLEEFIESDDPPRRQRTVNQRLTPIFRALLDDPDGWASEYLRSADGAECEPCWVEIKNSTPSDHEGCNRFRLVRKGPAMITVRMPKPTHWDIGEAANWSAVVAFDNDRDSKLFVEGIRKAMEGK